MERDTQFTQKKAEGAMLQSHFQDKYQLPKVSFGDRASMHIQAPDPWALDSFAPLWEPLLSAPKTHGKLGEIICFSTPSLLNWNLPKPRIWQGGIVQSSRD